jgi:hypothetical protein
MTITSVSLDTRSELKYVFVYTSDPIPPDTTAVYYMDDLPRSFPSCVFEYPSDLENSPIVPPNGSIGFSFEGTGWNFGDVFALVNSEGVQEVLNYTS